MRIEFLHESWWKPIKAANEGITPEKFTLRDLIDSYHDWILGTGVYKRRTTRDQFSYFKDKLFSLPGSLYEIIRR